MLNSLLQENPYLQCADPSHPSELPHLILRDCSVPDLSPLRAAGRPAVECSSAALCPASLPTAPLLHPCQGLKDQSQPDQATKTMAEMAPAFVCAAEEVPRPGIERDLHMVRFKRRKKLGSGSFGQVYQCRDTVTKSMFALKFVLKRGMDDTDRLHLRREIGIQTFINHKNILRCFGFFQDPTRIFVILDLAPGGNLTQFIQKQPRGRCDERLAADLLQQVARGLQYLHQKQIIHRDRSKVRTFFG